MKPLVIIHPETGFGRRILPNKSIEFDAEGAVQREDRPDVVTRDATAAELIAAIAFVQEDTTLSITGQEVTLKTKGGEAQTIKYPSEDEAEAFIDFLNFQMECD